MSQENKHGVDLSELITGKSSVRFYDKNDKAVYTGSYLGPGDEGWFRIRFGHHDYRVHPDHILRIFEPEQKWE